MRSKDVFAERFRSVRTFWRKKHINLADDVNPDIEPPSDAGDFSKGPFDIPSTKDASIDSLKKWRQVAIVLNATRRFRYTCDSKKNDMFKDAVTRVKAYSLIIMDHGLDLIAKAKGNATPPPPPPSEFGISQGELALLTRDKGYGSLMKYGGVEGLAVKLKSDLNHGISSDADEILRRKTVFGLNAYRYKKQPIFWNFVWDACKNPTLVILLFAAPVCCLLYTSTKGLKEGWHEGVTIATAVFVDVLVTATSDYFQSLQFHKHYDDNRIHVEGIRQGTRLMISISDIVVGDVLLLKAGDQVPADGILMSGYSLRVVELSMTGETNTVDKGQKDPFLLSGSEVARGCSTMPVTSVGINTDCGLIMASIPDDLGEEMPLQVRLNGMATFIGLVSLLVAASLPIALLIRYFTGQAKFPNVKFRPSKTKAIAAFDGVIKIFTVAVIIMVVAVPEGLPLALTLMYEDFHLVDSNSVSV